MSLHLMIDAAYPPENAYPGAEAVAGYIGGNTPHVWTVAEWQRFAHLVQFPIWTGYMEDDPAGHGNEAVAAARSLGFSQSPPSGNRRAIILDFETESNAAWVNAFGAVIWASGYETLIYESASVQGNPPKEGRWIAAWDGNTDLPPGSIGHQYKADVPWGGSQVDLSVIDGVMLAHGGQGARG